MRVVDLLPGMREDVYVFVVWNVCFGSLDEGASGVCVCVCVCVLTNNIRHNVTNFRMRTEIVVWSNQVCVCVHARV